MTEQTGDPVRKPEPLWPQTSSSIPPTGPGTLLWLGLGLAAVGAVLYLVGLNKVIEDGKDSLMPAVGLLVLAFGGIVSAIGAVGLGVLLALTRHEWNREHGKS